MADVEHTGRTAGHVDKGIVAESDSTRITDFFVATASKLWHRESTNQRLAGWRMGKELHKCLEHTMLHIIISGEGI